MSHILRIGKMNHKVRPSLITSNPIAVDDEEPFASQITTMP
jgi:hypothetical protein